MGCCASAPKEEEADASADGPQANLLPPGEEEQKPPVGSITSDAAADTAAAIAADAATAGLAQTGQADAGAAAAVEARELPTAEAGDAAFAASASAAPDEEGTVTASLPEQSMLSTYSISSVSATATSTSQPGEAEPLPTQSAAAESQPPESAAASAATVPPAGVGVREGPSAASAAEAAATTQAAEDVPLQTRFEALAAEKGAAIAALANAEKLEFYGLYKQATTGDVTGARPGVFDAKARAKYDAWAKRKGMGSEEAMKLYVAKVSELGL